jgi:signal transduction histidine kinase
MRWGRVVSDPTIQPRVRFLLLRREARSIPVEVHASAVFHDGRFGGMQGAARDLSEFERLEADRRHQAAELAVAQERSHLARELHDSVTQALFSMTLTTRTVEMLLTRGDRDAARARLDELRSLQRDALAEMRALIFALRPGSLEKDGLVQALRTYTEAISQRSALPIDLEAEPLERLPAPVEDAVYRVAQEAIHNIVKHAMATRATVRLWREGDDVHLEVDDDGSGFEPAAVSGGRLGVAGMRARASLIGGQLEIRSERDRGTRVRLVVRIGA